MARKLSEKDYLDILALKRQGLTNKEIAKRYGIHPTSVSRILKKAKKLEEELIDILPERLIVKTDDVKPVDTSDPFEGLKLFYTVGDVSLKTATVAGAAISSIIEGFRNRDLPEDKRTELVARGFSILGGNLYAAYRAFQRLSKDKGGGRGGRPVLESEVPAIEDSNSDENSR